MKKGQNTMNLPNMDLADFQMLAALTNAAAAAQQQQQAQQAAAAFASLTAQQNQAASHYSRQSTPPISTTNSPKVSTNNTRTPTPTQNGIPQISTTANANAGANVVTSSAVVSNTTTVASVPASTTAATVTTPSATPGALDPQSQSKYQQLLSVIEEMNKDIRPTYAGSKSSAERLKRGIVYARILVRDCLMETERSARN